jgi:WD40 repeat protein
MFATWSGTLVNGAKCGRGIRAETHCARGKDVPTLEVLASQEKPGDKEGEIFSCAFTQDSAFVLSGGWDGQLRLWEAESGRQVTSFKAGAKPLSACAISPDGKQWSSGSMDGVMAVWDPVSHQQTALFLAHTRPVSAIAYSPNGAIVATAGWDRKLSLRKVATIREGFNLTGHGDLVVGCRFLPDLTHLMSWSHDGTIRLWDLPGGNALSCLSGHTDRVNGAAVSPDGRWIVSASRDKELKLWDWSERREIKTVQINAEPRAVFFLSDGTSLVTVDAEGWLTIFSAPDLETQEEIETELPVQCAELSPSATMIALGCTDGRVRFVAVGGVDMAPLTVSATPTLRQVNSPLGFLFGKSKVRQAFACTCPACQQTFELDRLPDDPKPCPHCRRILRLCHVPELAGKS